MSCPPILILGFNRPEVLRKVIAAVRNGAPARVYLAADGPRDSVRHPSDAAACEEVRRLMSELPWDCHTKTLFAAENLGLGRAVAGAVDWFFKHEESGIVLEDDCVPAPDFFRFCHELLDRYADDDRVMSIRGSRYALPAPSGTPSYVFTRYFDCIGWASWRRAWGQFRFDMHGWRSRAGDPPLPSLGRRDRRYWCRTFDKVEHSGVPRTWTSQWNLAHFANCGLSIAPAVNLVSHVGGGNQATNCKRGFLWDDNPLGQLDFPLKHPVAVEPDDAFDRSHAAQRNNHRPWLARKFRQFINRWQIGPLAWRRGGVGRTLDSRAR